MSFPAIAATASEVVAALASPATSYIATATVTQHISVATVQVDRMASDNAADDEKFVAAYLLAIYYSYQTIVRKVQGFGTDQEIAAFQYLLNTAEKDYLDWMLEIKHTDAKSLVPTMLKTLKTTDGFFTEYRE